MQLIAVDRCTDLDRVDYHKVSNIRFEDLYIDLLYLQRRIDEQVRSSPQVLHSQRRKMKPQCDDKKSKEKHVDFSVK